MWVLVFVFVQSGTAFTVPGYSSAETCSAGASQIAANLQKAIPTALFSWQCTHSN
jgi:hypothetical protein